MRGFRMLAIMLIVWTSAAYADEGPRVRVGKEVTPLVGVIAFCKELPARCEAHSKARVAMSASRMAELVRVNLAVNAKITPQVEPPGVDVWQDRDFSTGDCEDFALLKRRELIALGWPPGALRLTIVTRKRSDTELHAILVATTDLGDFVLDTAGDETGEVRPWDPREFHGLRMIWGADAKWYALVTSPGLTVGSAK